MTTSTRHRATSALDHLVAGVARGAELALASGYRVLGRAQRHVHAWRVGRDPSTKLWVQHIQARATAGTLTDDAFDFDLLLERVEAERHPSWPPGDVDGRR